VRLAEIPALEIISSNETTTSAGKYCCSASRASWRTNLFQRESHGGEPGAFFLIVRLIFDPCSGPSGWRVQVNPAARRQAYLMLAYLMLAQIHVMSAR
jgi:hypothetical protein